jgi:hypothetical protein
VLGSVRETSSPSPPAVVAGTVAVAIMILTAFGRHSEPVASTAWRTRGPRRVRMQFNLRAASGTADEMRIEHTIRVFGE